MRVRQCNALAAARRAVTCLTTTPPATSLTAMPATVTQQGTALGATICQLDAQASAHTAAAGTITDRASAAKAAATELGSDHLVPIRTVAKRLATGSTGGTLSSTVASRVTIPHDDTDQTLLAAASTAVRHVTPDQDLCIARGRPTDFLEQLTAQNTTLSQAISATGTARTTRVASTADIVQLMQEVRKVTSHGAPCLRGVQVPPQGPARCRYTRRASARWCDPDRP
jgi:hypothetical protein